jgi:hypothetical protein
VGGLSGIKRNSFPCVVAVVLIILFLLWAWPNTRAQTSTALEPAAKFSVPAYRGVISFAANGTYSAAVFENNMWVFTNLLLNRSQPLENLEISAEYSNITVDSYRFSNVGFPSDRLSISVQGKGEQVINMGIGAYSGNNVDWVVSSNGTFLNGGWNVSHNGTVTLIGLTGNISIIYFDFTGQLPASNQPFYEAHSVAIAIAVAVAVTVAAAVVLKVRARRNPSEGDLSKNV